MRALMTRVAASALLALTGVTHAALVDRGGGMIYDTSRNITWLADMNYALTSGYDADGWMNWHDATQWASNLVFGGYDDWRLPTLNPSDTTCSLVDDPGGGLPLQYWGHHCTGGELSGLFVTDFGNQADQSVLEQAGDTPEQIANLALFTNIQTSGYWSSADYAPEPDTYAFFFGSGLGEQAVANKTSLVNAVAVRDGDVALNVPEPHSLALVAFGLTLVAAGRRSRGP